MVALEAPATAENCFRCLCDSRSVPILPAEIALAPPPIFFKVLVLGATMTLEGAGGSCCFFAAGLLLLLRSAIVNF